MNPVAVTRGDGPIVLGQPHSGVYVPPPIWDQLNDLGRALLDTDWHVPKLYDDLVEGLTVVRANFSRYVIDANRDPEGSNLYPGKNTTTLVPETTFDGAPIWREKPTEREINERMRDYHAPYHSALRTEIERVQASHGMAVLFDCHSIRSEISFLFDGKLPDLNIGTNDGASCAAEIRNAAERACAAAPNFSHVIDGRFKGGWTTRHYGKPDQGVHAIQLELAQSSYLVSEDAPFAFDAAKAAGLRQVLKSILNGINETVDRQLKLEA